MNTPAPIPTVSPWAWVEPYLGIPFQNRGRSRDGADCWGLLHMVYAEQAGIILPSYAADYVDTAESALLSVLIAQETGNASPWCCVTAPQCLTAVLFRQGRHACHVGVMADEKHVLHMANQSHVVLDPIEAPRLTKRLVGFFNHRDMM